MNQTYASLADEAVSSEKVGEFFKAAQVWRKAEKLASGANSEWSNQRACFCNCAFKRSKQGNQ